MKIKIIREPKTEKVKKESKFLQTTFGKKLNEVWQNNFFRIVWVRLGFLALLLNFVIEILNRMSILNAFVHLVTHPFIFLYNTLIVYFTLSFVAFFRKRLFVGGLISAIWMGLGITNGIISRLRKTPFTAQDFRNIDEGIKILPKYFSKFGIVLLIALIILVIIGIVFLAIKTPKYKGKLVWWQSLIASVVSFGVVFAFTKIGMSTNFLASNFGNIRQAYRDYGFGYCFTSSLLNTGVKKPKDYSKSTIKDIVKYVEENYKVGGSDAITDGDYPNIIFVQLESLFDPTLVKGLNFSSDPIPNLHRLYNYYSSGYFSVPSFGAGTANTEFEVMTGMNLDDFGPGEYPYKTVLLKTSSEAVGYDLKAYDYRISALHDNEGDFYHRNEVFDNLGYDSFTSIEYFNDFETTHEGWAKDECLIDQIFGIMNDSDNKDFIYTISVEGHGDYPSDTDGMNFDIRVSDNTVTDNVDGFEYYVNMIHSMDKFVGDLCERASEYDEKTIIVFYGDHLPTFEIEDSDLENGNIYQTQYVIWNNFGMKKIDKDIQAYQLSSMLLSRLGMTGGIVSKFHNVYMNMEEGSEEEYLQQLKELEYDILYGNCYAYGGTNPYEETALQMGYKTIKITDAYVDEYKNTRIVGRNFTWASKVKVNGDSVSTTINSSNELILSGYTIEPGDEIVVEQVSSSDAVLSKTSVYTFEE